MGIMSGHHGWALWVVVVVVEEGGCCLLTCLLMPKSSIGGEGRADPERARTQAKW